MDLTLEEAISVVAELHRGQVDKSGDAYVLHPIRVMLAMEPSDTNGRLVALFHDTVEDCAVEFDTLEDWIGGDNALAVMALTKRAGETLASYYVRIRANRVAWRVKRADVADNLGRLDRITDARTRERLANKYQMALAALS